MHDRTDVKGLSRLLGHVYIVVYYSSVVGVSSVLLHSTQTRTNINITVKENLSIIMWCLEMRQQGRVCQGSICLCMSCLVLSRIFFLLPGCV